MELREYLSIRKAYNLVRQEMDAERRLTFVEFAILCRLNVLDRPMNTSEIAEYQGALRPTMTHRTKHLSRLGLLRRSKGSSDRRNVVCEITESGLEFTVVVCRSVCDVLHSGSILSRTTPQRIYRYVDAMGGVSCMSGDLVLLGIAESGNAPCTISDLVSVLGLLQPTVSMSVASLEKDGMVYRERQGRAGRRSTDIRLTDQGERRARELTESIRALVVKRKP